MKILKIGKEKHRTREVKFFVEQKWLKMTFWAQKKIEKKIGSRVRKNFENDYDDSIKGMHFYFFSAGYKHAFINFFYDNFKPTSYHLVLLRFYGSILLYQALSSAKRHEKRLIQTISS